MRVCGQGREGGRQCLGQVIVTSSTQRSTHLLLTLGIRKSFCVKYIHCTQLSIKLSQCMHISIHTIPFPTFLLQECKSEGNKIQRHFLFELTTFLVPFLVNLCPSPFLLPMNIDFSSPRVQIISLALHFTFLHFYTQHFSACYGYLQISLQYCLNFTQYSSKEFILQNSILVLLPPGTLLWPPTVPA